LAGARRASSGVGSGGNRWLATYRTVSESAGRALKRPARCYESSVVCRFRGGYVARLNIHTSSTICMSRSTSTTHQRPLMFQILKNAKPLIEAIGRMLRLKAMAALVWCHSGSNGFGLRATSGDPPLGAQRLWGAPAFVEAHLAGIAAFDERVPAAQRDLEVFDAESAFLVAEGVGAAQPPHCPVSVADGGVGAVVVAGFASADDFPELLGEFGAVGPAPQGGVVGDGDGRFGFDDGVAAGTNARGQPVGVG